MSVYAKEIREFMKWCVERFSKYDCPDCVMANVDYETIKVPYEEDVVIGYEPDIPENCTLEVCPWLGYEPVFKEGK